ncbi:NAD-dependent epimerase/dehydratase family protein [Solihabitans fulvus]|uniref:NAD-dependent epimerase/dehydratase family protein n=1 Tax=Solihabitans fulvus TaxID=1892852 RepID=A0A5B2XQF3_9PSEU|nr:NAD-dependent epimerase/dehydratase family protein [Solihabitans fulvus]KAA2265091.1 NAD-dependent epimerase/dehydratase family protein [Solihabitans fulvus]
MRVLLIGGSGYLGTVLAEHLSTLGHEVVVLTRPAKANTETPYERRVGDLTDPASLTAAVTPDIDAVINLGQPSGDEAVDRAAIDALTAPLRGTDRAFLYTSGVWVLGATGDTTADEATPTNPIPIVGYRPAIESHVLATAQDGVRATVVRPGVVHGRGGGIPAMLVDLARRQGAPVAVADLSVRWPMIHVDDLATLFAMVVENAPAGTLWHGVTQPAVSVRDLSVAAGQAAGVSGEPQVWPLEDARAELGALFADALALDQSVSGDAVRDRLGWQPSNTDAVADLAAGSYR